MMAHIERPHFTVWLARRPVPVLVGAVLGFLACCAAGRSAAQRQPFGEFVRFHTGIAPDTHFYPTFSQTLNLARSHVQPGKVLVIIGGNSVMQGVGQRVNEIWTRTLQSELGDKFVVLNLAMRGGAPNEFGALVAERLLHEGVPTLYVVGTVHQYFGGEWDGLQYRYFFWDAAGKGLLPPEPRREAWLATQFAERYAHDEPMQERRRRGTCDGWTYAADLWNLLTYRSFATIWTPLTHPHFWRRHSELTDTDPGNTIPWEIRYRPATLTPSMNILRSAFESPQGKVVLDHSQDETLRSAYEFKLPEALRRRTLMVLRLEGTYYRSRLKPEEQQRYADVHAAYADLMRSVGLRAQIIGGDFVDVDYHDRSHLSESGGRKLGVQLAPTIRAMAVEEGLLPAADSERPHGVTSK